MDFRIVNKDGRQLIKVTKNETWLGWKEETYTYLKLLGAKQIEEDRFILDGVVLEFNEREHQFILVDGYPEELQNIFEKTNLKWFFERKRIYSLEGLVLLHTIMNSTKSKLFENYQKNLEEMRKKELIYEFVNNSSHFNIDCIKLDNTREECVELENSLKKLFILAYPLCIPGIEKHFDELKENITLNICGERRIGFSWNYYTDYKQSRLLFNGSLKMDKENIVASIVLYDPNYGQKHIIYTFTNDQHYPNNNITYFPPNWDLYHNRIELDLINDTTIKGEKVDLKATKRDYQRYCELIDHFYNVMVNQLPYLSIDKTKIKRK